MEIMVKITTKKMTKKGMIDVKRKILFKDWAKQWLEYERNFIKESSYGTYSTIVYNHLIPHLGKLLVSDINQLIIQNLILELTKHGRIDKTGGLSEKTVKDIITILKNCLKDAESNNLIIYNFAKLNYPRTRKEKKLNVLSIEQQSLLQNAILKNITNKNIGILFTLQTGVRIGELCAIQNADINLKDKTVRINKTLQRTFAKTDKRVNKSKIIITSPKSDSSFRTIPLSDTLVNALRNLDLSISHNYLLSGNEKYIEPRTYMNYYKKFLEISNITYINFHGLRHTFATRCIESGGDSKALSEILGHSSIRITLDLYVHPQMDTKRRCVELINLL